MALTDEQNVQLEELFRAKLQEQYNRGIRVGVLTVSKIVFDKLNDGSKPLMNRIEEVKRFCKIAPDVEQKYNEISTQSDSENEVESDSLDSKPNTD